MKFLNETLISTAEVLFEGIEGQPKKMYIQGIFMQGNVTNKNKRMYPTKTLVKECERYNREVVEQNLALGELNHPERISVDPKEASHRIVKMWVEGNNVLGKALILDTPNGRILKALLEGGTRFGVSSRAVGSLKQCEDYNEVQEDFRLSCVDAVLNPSAPDAVINHIMESKDFAVVENMIVEVNQATEQAILERNGCNLPCSCKLAPKEPVKEEVKKPTEEEMLKAFESIMANVQPKLVREAKSPQEKDDIAFDIEHHRKQIKFHKEMAQERQKSLNTSFKAIEYHTKELHRHIKKSVKEEIDETINEEKGTYHVYDNGGKTQDRYTVFTHNLHQEGSKSKKPVEALAMDEHPTHPQGFSQMTSAQVGNHLGKKIDFSSLPEKLQQHIHSRLS